MAIKAIDVITKAAEKGAFSVDLGKNSITLTDEMHNDVQSAFTCELVFDGDVVSWQEGMCDIVKCILNYITHLSVNTIKAKTKLPLKCLNNRFNKGS